MQQTIVSSIFFLSGILWMYFGFHNKVPIDSCPKCGKGNCLRVKFATAHETQKITLCDVKHFRDFCSAFRCTTVDQLFCDRKQSVVISCSKSAKTTNYFFAQNEKSCDHFSRSSLLSISSLGENWHWNVTRRNMKEEIAHEVQKRNGFILQHAAHTSKTVNSTLEHKTSASLPTLHFYVGTKNNSKILCFVYWVCMANDGKVVGVTSSCFFFYKRENWAHTKYARPKMFVVCILSFFLFFLLTALILLCAMCMCVCVCVHWMIQVFVLYAQEKMFASRRSKSKKYEKRKMVWCANERHRAKAMAKAQKQQNERNRRMSTMWMSHSVTSFTSIPNGTLAFCFRYIAIFASFIP